MTTTNTAPSAPAKKTTAAKPAAKRAPAKQAPAQKVAACNQPAKVGAPDLAACLAAARASACTCHGIASLANPDVALESAPTAESWPAASTG